MLLIFGAGNFMIPALLGMVTVLIISRKHIEKKQAQAESAKSEIEAAEATLESEQLDIEVALGSEQTETETKEEQRNE